LEVKNEEGKETATTSCMMSNDERIILVTDKLDERASYSFIIISNNSIGQQSTTPVRFCERFF